MQYLTYDKVFGLVNYGEIGDFNPNEISYITKMRCKNCGAAWLAENYIAGYWCCPKCLTEKEGNILKIH